jgi:phage gp46-like protein
MSKIVDIGLFIQDDGDFGNRFDFEVANGDLKSEEGLRTALIVSLFSDARATKDEVFPNQETRGFWGDAVSEILGDRWGSKLWLLDRAKQTNETRVKAEEYAIEALQWLIDDGVASAVDVEASFPADKSLLLDVVITRPNGDNISYTFDSAWKAEETR